MRTRWRSGGCELLVALLLAACAGRVTEVGGVAILEGASEREFEPQEIAQIGAGAVAVLTTDSTRGLAFVIDPAGYLITSRHIIEDSDYIERIHFPGLTPPREFRSIRVIYSDPQRDLALLRVDTAGIPLPSLTLATDDEAPIASYLQRADRVLLLARSENDAREETFVAHTGSVDDLEVFNPALGEGAYVGLTNDVRQGQSGGPVLDRYGRAVGVVTWTWRHRIGGYAIPIAEAGRMLRERPNLEGSVAQEARARLRAASFVAAVHTSDLDVARGMLSPTFARTIRSATMEQITAEVAGSGGEVVSLFFAALEELIEALEEGKEATQLEQFRELVIRTGTRDFREALGVGDSVSSELVVSFFFELGKAYMAARYYGEQEPDQAIETAIDRLRTLEAARTFAFASLTQTLDQGPAEVTKVELLPGVYAPQAMITLKLPAREGALMMRMNLEWGDWYVAQIQAVGDTLR